MDGKGGGDNGKPEKRKPSEEGRARNGFNGRTWGQNQCYTCNSEYHFAPQCAQEGNRFGGAPPPTGSANELPNKPYSSFAMDPPLEVRSTEKTLPGGPGL